MSPRFTFVLPIHNEAPWLSDHVRRLCERLATLPGSAIVLAENGSRDGSRALCHELAASAVSVPIRVVHTDDAGLGHALRLGIRDALSFGGNDVEHWIVFTAADLPFGFSDLDGVLERLATRGTRASPVALFIGSKAHPASKLHVDLGRRLASVGYGLARRAAGMRTGDSQGTLFMRADVVGTFARRVRARDFFWTTEFVWLLERAGQEIVELPIVYAAQTRPSSVRVLRDGTRMMHQLLRLRRTAPPHRDR